MSGPELCGSPKKAANWFMGEVLRLTKDKGMDVEKVSFTPEHLADLIQMVEKKEVSAQNAKKVFEKVFEVQMNINIFIYLYLYLFLYLYRVFSVQKITVR